MNPSFSSVTQFGPNASFWAVLHSSILIGWSGFLGGSAARQQVRELRAQTGGCSAGDSAGDSLITWLTRTESLKFTFLSFPIKLLLLNSQTKDAATIFLISQKKKKS